MAYAFNDDKSKVVLDDFIVVGEQLSGSVTILSSMSTKEVGYSFNITKTGYIPIGIVGVEFEKTGSTSGDTINAYVQFTGWNFYSQSGNDYLHLGTRRMSNYSSEISFIIKTKVLYMKIIGE